jgi:hypothetical protein
LTRGLAIFGLAEEVRERGMVVDLGLAQVPGGGRARGSLAADLLPTIIRVDIAVPASLLTTAVV